MKNATPYVAAIALVVPACLGLLSPGPALLRPLPVVTVLPAFMLGPLSVSAVFVPTILFSVWNPGLFRSQEKVPVRSLVLLAVLTVFTPLYFITSWKYGLKYQGPQLTYELCMVNIVWLLALWVVFILARRKSSFKANLLAHFLLFTWLGWYAFPYLGELP